MTRGDGIGSSSQHWGTPQTLFDRLNRMFQFNLDPCAANAEIAKCDAYYTPVEDGLKQDWVLQREIGDVGVTECWKRGRVFLNPPYGRNQVNKWVKKAALELESGRAELVVALLPASVGTHWFNDYVMPYASRIWFVRGRIAFEDYSGVSDSSSQANFDSVIVVMRKGCDEITVSTWRPAE